MRIIYLFLLGAGLIGSINSLDAQTTAIDFNQSDCSGTEHHLFNELDAGKVVVIDYIMLNCAPCIIATTALENLIAPYQSTHPGRVVLYSYGFLNSYTCDQLSAWVTNNNFTHPVFNNGEEQVNYYGGMGMPTIVVLGSNEHKVYYNGIGYSQSHDEQIKAAIDNALLYNPTGIGERLDNDDFSIYPTVFSNTLSVDTKLATDNTKILITDLTGKVVLRSDLQTGSTSLQTADLAAGMYLAVITSDNKRTHGYKLLKQNQAR